MEASYADFGHFKRNLVKIFQLSIIQQIINPFLPRYANSGAARHLLPA